MNQSKYAIRTTKNLYLFNPQLLFLLIINFEITSYYYTYIYCLTQSIYAKPYTLEVSAAWESVVGVAIAAVGYFLGSTGYSY